MWKRSWSQYTNKGVDEISLGLQEPHGTGKLKKV